MKLESSDTAYYSLDLQKVRMLPEIPGSKTAIFTQRICCYNETFSPLGTGENIAILWHQGIGSRNDEDITSAYMKFFKRVDRNGVRHLVLWADNCTGQNKNWCLFSNIISLMNDLSLESLHTVTMKYFEPGHSFMSADSFHARVEYAVRQMKNLFDFDDFLRCVNAVGTGVVMEATDFLYYESYLSHLP